MNSLDQSNLSVKSKKGKRKLPQLITKAKISMLEGKWWMQGLWKKLRCRSENTSKQHKTGQWEKKTLKLNNELDICSPTKRKETFFGAY